MPWLITSVVNPALRCVVTFALMLASVTRLRTMIVAKRSGVLTGDLRLRPTKLETKGRRNRERNMKNIYKWREHHKYCPEVLVSDYFAPITIAVGPAPSVTGPALRFGRAPSGFMALVYTTETFRVVDAPGGKTNSTLILGECSYAASLEGAKSIAKQLARAVQDTLPMIRKDRRKALPLGKLKMEFGSRSGWILLPYVEPEEETLAPAPWLAEVASIDSSWYGG